jgi:hypothetical protein
MTRLPYLRRYMQLPQALHILSKRCLNLGNTRYWEDRSEAAIFEKYRIEKKLKGVLALCFTESPETNHHWKIYADGVSGVCIEFDKAGLIKAFNRAKERLQHGSVEYVKIKDADNYCGRIDRWPFVKRLPFKDEKEYRVIYDDPDGIKFFELGFELHYVNQIHLSPWIQRNVYESIEALIRGIPGCDDMQISRTTLLENQRWIDSFVP